MEHETELNTNSGRTLTSIYNFLALISLQPFITTKYFYFPLRYLILMYGNMVTFIIN